MVPNKVIYLSTKQQGVTSSHGVKSHKTVSVKSGYIQLEIEPSNQFMEQTTDPCHSAVVQFIENPISTHFVTFSFLIPGLPQLPVRLDDS
jgi:hypothetical protein